MPTVLYAYRVGYYFVLLAVYTLQVQKTWVLVVVYTRHLENYSGISWVLSAVYMQVVGCRCSSLPYLCALWGCTRHRSSRS